MTIELTAGHSGLVHITAQGAEIAVNETPEFTAMFLMQQVLAPGSQVRTVHVGGAQ